MTPEGRNEGQQESEPFEPAASGAARAGARRGRRRIGLGRALLLGWGAALIASFAVQMSRGPRPERPAPEGAAQIRATIPEMTPRGPRADRTAEIAILEWAGEPTEEDRAPVVLLHGSPGSAEDLAELAKRLARDGRRALSVDLPGYGASEKWVGDYSLESHARSVLGALERLGVSRAHVVGWSLGGAVAAHMADMEPERIASVTLMASLGSQEAEGSGNYTFEHVKYALGYALVVALPELIPHFGALPERHKRVSFIRSFWDTDLRPMGAVLKRLRVPALIIHGRKDFLVPSWGAEWHHELAPASRLVMLDANHFLPLAPPFGQADETAAHVAALLSRHDAPGAAALTGSADFAPLAGDGAAKVGRFTIRHQTAWWLIIMIIVIGTFITEDGTVIAVGLAIAHGQIDLGVGLIGCLVGIAAGDFGLYMIGRVFGRRALRWPALRNWLPEQSLDRWGRWFDKHTIQAVLLARIIPGTRLPTYLAAGLLSRRTHGFLLWAGIAAFGWTPIVLTLVMLLGPGLLEALRSVFSGPVAVIVAVVVLFVAMRVVAYAFTWEGRRRLLRDVALPFRPEFWPPWIFYIPLVPYVAYLALTRRGVMTFSCINPGIAHGGGVVGESKAIILGKLERANEWIVPTAYIAAGRDAAERAAEAHRVVETDARFGGYPIVLKPDEAQRGHGFKVVRTREEVEAYFRDMTRAAILQAFHPGPHEVGVLWSRVPGTGHGRIFSITRKRFPVITGDGETPLDRLILRHPRFRMQAETFLKRFDAQRDRVLARGETLTLAVAGNHCQGTMFLDGEELATAALEHRIDEIACAFEHDGLDFGRFDARYASEDELREGRGFSIIELNGTMSESTNVYDPNRSVFWMYRVLFRQWRTMYDLGLARKREGVKPMRLRELMAAVRDHFKGRPGSSVAD